jgi:2-polyprenyl-3-methyl-5-hydroxy-6-metoxy-1,4-benzoquinol methylase
MGRTASRIARGKPAEYDQEIVRRRYRRTVEHVALDGKTVLDFGCGNGAQTIQFTAHACTIIAADIELSGLQRFAALLRERSIRSVSVLQSDGLALPFKSQSFDIVLSYEVLEHVRDESTVLREFHRVLKPGGAIVLSVPNKAWIFETHGAHLPLLRWNRVPFFSWLPRSIHRRFARARIYRRREIVRLLESTGFRVCRAEYITAPMDVVRIPAIQHVLRRTLFRSDTTPYPPLSTSILLYAERV